MYAFGKLCIDGNDGDWLEQAAAAESDGIRLQFHVYRGL